MAPPDGSGTTSRVLDNSPVAGSSGAANLAEPGPSRAGDFVVPKPPRAANFAEPGPSTAADFAMPEPSREDNFAVAGSSTGTNDTVDRSPPNLYSEADRYKTFETWPVSFVAPDRLAAAGFYYLKRNDVVKCAFCGIELGGWLAEDDPLADHKKWSPRCPYIGKIPVGNIPMDPDNPAVVPDPNRTRGNDTCGYGITTAFRTQGPEREATGEAAAFESLGVFLNEAPKHKDYSSKESRVNSFGNVWPVALGQRPDKLSEAGFFYNGKGDETFCFHCGGGLRDWKNSDDPFVEHARWYPKCVYILNKMGKEFVEKFAGKNVESLAKKDVQVPSEVKEAVHIHKPETKGASTSAELPLHVQEAAEKPAVGDRLCRICYGEELGIVFLPCGHLVACITCAMSLENCPVCRKSISATVRTFLT